MAKLVYRKMSESEVESALTELTDWTVEAGEIVRKFEFKTYKDGLVFAVSVGYLADRLDHHPNIDIGYAKVRVSVNTHSVDGLSPYDFELARQIETLSP